MRGWFITGTGTGVGKTVLAASIVAALRAKGHAVSVRKPVITGLDELPDSDWPPDHVLLAGVAGCLPEEVMRFGYGPAVSPHLAAQLCGSKLQPGELRAAALDAGHHGGCLIVEGVGGLLVPLGDGYDVRTLARDVGLPLMIAAHPGLGTINHTLLTLEAARSAELDVAGVVLTPWPHAPTAVERSNAETIERLGSVEVTVLPLVPRASPELLAAAGVTLPLERWLALQ